MALQPTLSEKYNSLLGQIRNAEQRNDKESVNQIDEELTEVWMTINGLSTPNISQ